MRRATAGIDRFLTDERLRIYPIAILIGEATLVGLLLLARFASAIDGEPGLPDFIAPWTGANLFLESRAEHLYDPVAQGEFQRDTLGASRLSWFVSPPHVAIMYIPLTYVEYRWAAILWTAFSIICLVAAVRLMEPFAPSIMRNHRTGAVLVLAAVYPVFELLGAGQQSAVTLLIWAAGIRLAMTDYQILTGFVFSLGLMKPQLFLLMPFVLLALRAWRAIAALIVGSLLTLAINVWAVGTDGFRDWLGVIISPEYSALVQSAQAWKMTGLSAFFVTLLPAELGPMNSIWANAIMLAVVAVATWQIFAWVRSGIDQRAVWSLALLATAIGSPHFLAYELVLVLIPCLYLVEVRNRRSVRSLLFLLFVVTWTLPLRHVAAQFVVWPFTWIELAVTPLILVLLWRELCRYTELDADRARAISL